MTGINPASVSTAITRSGNATGMTEQIKRETEGLDTRKAEREDRAEKQGEISSKRDEIAQDRDIRKQEESRQSNRNERESHLGQNLDILA